MVVTEVSQHWVLALKYVTLITFIKLSLSPTTALLIVYNVY